MPAGRPIKDLRRSIERALAKHPDACWLWPYRDSSNPRDYGRLMIDGRIVKAHRHVWALFNGPVPDGLWILHHCDTVGCVNPRHLYAGDHADNMRDRALRERAHNLRLTNAQVVELRALRLQGMKHRELAARFNIALTTSVRICQGSRRQHV